MRSGYNISIRFWKIMSVIILISDYTLCAVLMLFVKSLMVWYEVTRGHCPWRHLRWLIRPGSWTTWKPGCGQKIMQIKVSEKKTFDPMVHFLMFSILWELLVMECLPKFFVHGIPESIETEVETYAFLNWNVYINDLKSIVGNGWSQNVAARPDIDEWIFVFFLGKKHISRDPSHDLMAVNVAKSLVGVFSRRCMHWSCLLVASHFGSKREFDEICEYYDRRFVESPGSCNNEQRILLHVSSLSWRFEPFEDGKEKLVQ